MQLLLKFYSDFFEILQVFLQRFEDFTFSFNPQINFVNIYKFELVFGLTYIDTVHLVNPALPTILPGSFQNFPGFF